jgi:4-diphosphocytidyl-2-C-methyl-D-erythritol kinase
LNSNLSRKIYKNLLFFERLLTKRLFQYRVQEMRGLEITAFAKINIGLEVFWRKSTGYHDIESIFQNVSLADSLRLCIDGRGSIAIEGELGCPPGRSSIYHAAMAFDEACGGLVGREGVSIHVKKGIPSGAGLGGAGADAAATLWGLNELLGTRFSPTELARLGGQVASDVPFFLFGGVAIVRGRGEKIFPIVPRTDFGLIIVQPSWTSSTPEAYEALDSLREECRGPNPYMPGTQETSYVSRLSDEELMRRYRSPVAQWQFRNDFQPVLEGRHPEYRELFSMLRGQGAGYAGLTGSGSCLFGVFESFGRAQEAGEKCRNILAERAAASPASTANIFIVQPLARSINVSYYQSCNEDTRPDKERPCYGSH